MFFSLNKKFFITIIVFLLLCSGVFLTIFDNTVGKKIQSERTSLLQRNQYVIELLRENISLRRQINSLQPNSSVQLSTKQDELSREQKLNEELMTSYNKDYLSLMENFRIIATCAAFTVILLIILWLLLKRWIIAPIDKLISLSVDVANGNFSKRIDVPKTKITDEFYTLMHTLNFMLNNIENNINDIKEKEMFLQNLIDVIPDAIRVIDDNYNIILSNKAYLNLAKNKYLCKSTKCYEAYSKDNKTPCSSSQHLCPLNELKKATKSTIKIIHSVNNRPLSINSARLILNNQYCIIESIRDLSDNVNYSHQQKISSLGFLASSLAHEIKNNLGAINIILDGIILKYHNSPNDTSEETKYLTMISNQIKESIKIPERLLKLSQSSDNNSTINITTSITDILSLLDYEIKSKGIELVKNFSNIKESILGNETDFKMILLNLTQNAIQAMPNGGILEIKTNTNKEEILINIKDNGLGIKKEDLKHIFEPFYSTHNQGEKKGTGLGLAIVKDLLQKFNATISVTSNIDVGTTFQIKIPRQKTQKMLVK